jgi:hypothetical protein
MATPPKTPTGTATPPRRKPAARKPAAKPRAPKAVAAADGATAPTTKPAAAKAPAARVPGRRGPGRPPKSATGAPATRAKPKTTATATKPAGRPAAAAKTAAKAAKTAAKAVAGSAPAKLVADTREKVGNPNFFGALIGGVVAIGAAVTGIFFATRKPAPGTKAHQADGTDSSASFKAGIADEGTIPE